MFTWTHHHADCITIFLPSVDAVESIYST